MEAFHSICWRSRRELIADVRKPEIADYGGKTWSGRLLLGYSITSRRLVTLNPKLKSNEAPDATGFFHVGGMPTASNRPERLLSKKVGATTALQQIKGVALYCDWSWWYPSGNRPLRQYLWASLPGAGYGGSSIKGWQPDCKIQRSGRNGRRDWCMSEVTAIISALVICIIICLSWAVNHYRDNAIAYKAQRDKNARRQKRRTRQLLTCRCVSYWCCCAR